LDLTARLDVLGLIILMSAKKLGSLGSVGNSIRVAGREAALALAADKVSVHKNGIEFRSPAPFTEWSEMTVTLQSPLDGSKLSCHGVVVACAGSKHCGYNVSMLFTSMTSQAEKQLGAIARSEFGAG
jgi:hypothetical protein